MYIECASSYNHGWHGCHQEVKARSPTHAVQIQKDINHTLGQPNRCTHTHAHTHVPPKAVLRKYGLRLVRNNKCLDKVLLINIVVDFQKVKPEQRTWILEL